MARLASTGSGSGENGEKLAKLKSWRDWPGRVLDGFWTGPGSGEKKSWRNSKVGENGLDGFWTGPGRGEKKSWRNSKVGETGLDGSWKGPGSCKIVSERTRALLSMSSSSILIKGELDTHSHKFYSPRFGFVDSYIDWN